MIYLLVTYWRPWLQAHHLGFARLFLDVTFQTTLATLLSFAIVILLAPRTIRWLRLKKIGDHPNFDQDQMNKLMEGKKGTPTMGGILIICAIAVTVLVLADLKNFYVCMALICLVWLGGVGAVDDWLKLTSNARASTSRQGLTAQEKLLFQIGLAIVLSVFTYRYSIDAASHTFFVPFFKGVGLVLPIGAFVAIGALVLTGSSNAVNLTDGLDGLAAGCMAIASFAFVVLALIAGSEEFSIGGRSLPEYLYLPYIPASGQMAVLAGAMLGACLGFLWFNCTPAAVFMGDTGSLALGGLLGYIAIVIRQELLLLIIGGIFAAEAMSVLIQVSYFKYTRRKYGEGRRVFLMSPLHHHFQKKNWSEGQVVVRFWLVGAMLAMMALATVKIR
ncbi:MAG: phospho-N-acetylmuramoyl-pentapeptide-transferase [Tepidisphaeraceae bacterium]|jgi:phospho-N-acetylmuramoyl-pentapeptide-transferase